MPDTWRGKALLGFLQLPEAMSYLRIQERDHPSLTDEAAKAKYEDAVNSVAALPAFDGIQPDIQDIQPTIANDAEADLSKVKKRLEGDPQLSSRVWDFKLVEIDPLISLQKQINIDISSQFAEGVRDSADTAGAVRLCLNTHLKRQNVTVSQDPVGFSVVSHNLNLSPMGFGETEVENPTTGEKMSLVTLSFGCLHSYVRVVHFGNRYFLRDGYHRTYALRSKGFTHVPCLLIEGLQPADIGVNGNLFPLELILSAKPPTLGHFDQVGVDVNLPKVLKVIRIKMEPFVIPT